MNKLPDRITTLFIDFDGTLIDSRPGIVEAMKRTFIELKKPLPQEETLTWAIGPGVEVVFERLFPNESPEFRKEAILIFRKHYDGECFRFTELFSGITVLLQKLAQSSYRRFLTTMKAKSGSEPIVAQLELAAYFHGIYCYVPFTGVKNKVELIAKVIEDLKIPPQEIAIIGDTLHDIESGKAHGLTTVAVAYGYATESQLLAASPDFLVKTVEELQRFLIK